MTAGVLLLCASLAAQAAAPPDMTGTPEDPLGAEEERDPADQPSRLRLYGFIDFTYYAPLMEKDNPWLQFFPRHRTFQVGNLNVYLAGDIAEGWRTMAEVRVLYAPRGGETIASDGTVVRTNTEVNDTAEFGRRIFWGGVQIERAYLEREIAPWLIIRGGQFLTPYGIWNVDHGAPSIVGIRRPWTVREQLFPEWQTGFEVLGTRVFGSVTAGYHLTLSNGRFTPDSALAQTDDPAVGARLHLEHRSEGVLRLGVSAYRGSYAREQAQWLPNAKGGVSQTLRVVESYRELAFATDVRYERGGLLAQGEAIYNERAYRDPGRPSFPDQSVLAPDLRRWGAYGLVGYRTARLALMPYVLLEYVNLGAGAYGPAPGPLPHVVSAFVGLNWRPAPTTVLKAELSRSLFPDHGAGAWGEHAVTVAHFQAAWVF